MKTKKYYMHTINGKPGAFDGTQICYGWHRMPLTSSLKQIKEEQKKSRAYRMKKNFDIFPDYGYLLVYLPNETKGGL
jgi:hypothetical protein